MTMAERPCRKCGEIYQTEVISAFGVVIPKLPRCPECLAREQEAQEAVEEAERVAAEERARAEIREQDPDVVLRRFGFLDRELEGKDLTSFSVPTDLHRSRLELAKRFSGGRLERPGMLLVGHPGRGKTHLARGIARSYVRQGLEFRYWKLQDVIAECKRRFRSDRETADDYVAWIGNFPGLVIIDELGRSRGDQWDTDCVVYPLADRRMAKPTIWISNFGLAELERKYDEAVVSRLQRCEVVTFPETMEDWRRR